MLRLAGKTVVRLAEDPEMTSLAPQVGVAPTTRGEEEEKLAIALQVQEFKDPP